MIVKLLILLVGFAQATPANRRPAEETTVNEAVSVAARAPASLRDRFLKQTGLQEGEYKLITPQPACFDGHVDLVKVGNQLSLRIRDQALIGRLDFENKSQTLVDPQCQVTLLNRIKKSFITSTETRVCDGKTSTIVVTALIQPGKLAYKRVEDGKTIASCGLEKQP